MEKLKSLFRSSIRVDAKDILLKHKTTKRELYESEFKKAEHAGFYDVIFMNTENEITEASRHNLFIEKDGQWFTPPIESGLLGGVKRAELIEQFADKCTVRKLYLDDILNTDRIFLTNSVRDMVEVTLDKGVQ